MAPEKPFWWFWWTITPSHKRAKYPIDGCSLSQKCHPKFQPFRAKIRESELGSITDQ